MCPHHQEGGVFSSEQHFLATTMPQLLLLLLFLTSTSTLMSTHTHPNHAQVLVQHQQGSSSVVAAGCLQAEVLQSCLQGARPAGEWVCREGESGRVWGGG